MKFEAIQLGLGPKRKSNVQVVGPLTIEGEGAVEFELKNGVSECLLL